MQGDAGGCRMMQGGSPESPDYRGRAPDLGPSGDIWGPWPDVARARPRARPYG